MILTAQKLIFRLLPRSGNSSGSLDTLAEMVNDTMILSGSEAYAVSLPFYNAIKSAVKDNQPGAKIIYDDLRARFPRGTTTTSETTETVVAK